MSEFCSLGGYQLAKKNWSSNSFVFPSYGSSNMVPGENGQMGPNALDTDSPCGQLKSNLILILIVICTISTCDHICRVGPSRLHGNMTMNFFDPGASLGVHFGYQLASVIPHIWFPNSQCRSDPAHKIWRWLIKYFWFDAAYTWSWLQKSLLCNKIIWNFEILICHHHNN